MQGVQRPGRQDLPACQVVDGAEGALRRPGQHDELRVVGAQTRQRGQQRFRRGVDVDEAAVVELARQIGTSDAERARDRRVVRHQRAGLLAADPALDQRDAGGGRRGTRRGRRRGREDGQVNGAAHHRAEHRDQERQVPPGRPVHVDGLGAHEEEDRQREVGERRQREREAPPPRREITDERPCHHAERERQDRHEDRPQRPRVARRGGEGRRVDVSGGRDVSAHDLPGVGSGRPGRNGTGRLGGSELVRRQGRLRPWERVRVRLRERGTVRDRRRGRLLSRGAGRIRRGEPGRLRGEPVRFRGSGVARLRGGERRDLGGAVRDRVGDVLGRFAQHDATPLRGFVAPRRGRRGQRPVAAEDAHVQVLEPFARLDAELLGEEVPRVPVGGEGLRLPAAPVQRQHQQVAQPLPQRELGHEAEQLGHQPRVLAQLQADLRGRLQRGGALLVQPFPGRVEERAVQPGQRRSAPQFQRLA